MTGMPTVTLLIDLRKCASKIDYDNSSSTPGYELGWAKLERIGMCLYKVYSKMNNKMPCAYITTFKPII